MRKYLITSLIIFLFTNLVAAQNVFVSGQLKGFEPESMVRVIVPSDLFSKLPHTLVTTHSEKTGDFSFDFELEHPVYAEVAVNLKKGSVFLQPDSKYRLEIKNDTVGLHGSIFDQQPPEINVLKGNTSLSDHLGTFNEMYNRFLMDHFRDIYIYHNISVLNDFKKRTDSSFANIHSPYLNNYIRYSLASLEWAARAMPLTAFAKTYFTGHKVLYDNVQYVEVFRDFFKAFFESTLNDPVNKNKLTEVMPSGDFQKLDAVFSKLALLKDDARVRQLAEMVSLEKYFYDNTFKHRDILKMFRNLSLHSKFSENRKIAHDFYLKLKQLLPGSPAPAFQLPDFKGNEYSLENFKHKFVLLAFYKTGDPLCKSQLSYLKSLAGHESDNFTPVVIVVGKHPDYYLKAYRSQKYSWPFLLLGQNILLLEKYQVMEYPAYVLINPDGTIGMAQAPMPEENAVERISHYTAQYKKRVKN